MSQSTLNSAIPYAIVRKLRAVRTHKLWVHVASALVVAAAVLLAAMGIAMLIDSLATLYDSRWRYVLTNAALSASALTVLGWLLVVWKRGLPWDRVAGDVDREIPQLEERWTTMTRLEPADTADPQLVHPAMFRRVAQEAVRWEPHVEPQQIISLTSLLRGAICLTVITLVLGIAVLFDWRRTTVLLRRFWWPGSSISATELFDAPGNVVVGRGEPMLLNVAVQGTPVDRATLFLRPSEGAERAIPIVAHGSDRIEFSHNVRAVDEPFAYRFRAGDGQTDWFRVDVADRPEIGALELTVTPPAYTGRRAKTFDKLPRRLSAIENSELEISLRPKAAVDRVELRLANDERLGLTAGDDGWHRWTTTLTESVSFAMVLSESHGLTNRNPPTCRIDVYPDTPPAVKVLTPDDQVAVRPDDTVEITFSAQDDVGVDSAELVVYGGPGAGGEPTPIATFPIALDEQQGARSVQGTVALDLGQFSVIDGSELSYEIRVREDRGASRSNTVATRPSLPSTAGEDSHPASNDAAEAATRRPRDTQHTAQEGQPGKPGPPLRETPSAGAMAQQGTPPGQPADSKPEVAADREAGRTASSGRRSLSSNDSATDAEKMPPNRGAEPSNRTASNSAEPPSGDREVAAQGSPANTSRLAAAGEPSESSASDPAPGDSMTRRGLDVPQTSSSQRMRLKVDQWAGSFAGQQREKLEMAIGPELEALDQTLAKAQQVARGVLDEVESSGPWRGTHDRAVGSAEQATVKGQKLIASLQQRSLETPYAFIGLQVADIGVAHVNPARSGLWTTLQSDGDERVTTLRDAWQHLGRARELLKELRGQFERTRREFQLAESVEQVKKMYQVYVENSQRLLQARDNDPTRYQRKLAQLELDKEYLARLQEVLEMRRDLRAELARILADDPRLLRRMMDALRNRSVNLREELADLVADQEDLNREVRAWTAVQEVDRPRIAQLLLLRQLRDATDIAASAGELQGRYQAWLPLERESKASELAAATKAVQQVATAASELSAHAQQFTADVQRPKWTAPAEGKAAATESPPPAADPAEALDSLSSEAEALYELSLGAEVALRQLGAREGDAEIALFATNRLVEVRRLIADTSAWVRQVRAHQAGSYSRAAEVDQYRLAMKTDELAGKLGSIEETLSGLMQRRDGSLPQPIAEKSRAFLAALDQEASPNQLAAVYALHSDDFPRATERQQAAGRALVRAERLYDEMMRLAIAEMDKLPVQDPISDLLDDPTLDELLAMLEQELPIAELLGIPRRPTNLQIIDDWLNGGMGGGGAPWLQQQMRFDELMARQRLDRAYRRAIARALQETDSRSKIEMPPPVRVSDWNRLVSQLGDDLGQGRGKAPPEQYRRAIDQYFAQISRAVAEEEEQAQ